MVTTLPAPVAAPTSPKRDFPSPKPNSILMWALGFVNRWFILSGLPLLRHIPVVRDLPGVRGYLRVRIDLPAADRARLDRAVNSRTAAFVGPNHPEFGTDWMIDKEISTLVAPRLACWAAHDIVASAPAFWCANNLVSNNGGDAAMEYSIQSALAGTAVLLHPEGTVRWTSDKIHPLFGGIAEMALETARRAAHVQSERPARPVYIVPIVWKLVYDRDVSAAMHADMRRIEIALDLSRGDELDVPARFHLLQENILSRQASHFGYPLESPRHADFFDRQTAFRAWLVADLETRYTIEPSDSIDRRIRRLDRAIRADQSRPRDDIARVAEAARLGGFTREVYATPLLSQEQIAESVKRIRSALLRHGLANTVHNNLPRPYGARIAHVRVPEPILVDPRRAAPDHDAYARELLDRTQSAMQQAVDAINAEHASKVGARSHPNPFIAGQHASGTRSEVHAG
ncbi:MAG: hypothetical protein ACREPM_15990 [Gemmatimonadaceae bacterium]